MSRPRKRNRKAKIIILTFILLTLAVMSSPMFSIKEIEVLGNNAVTKEKLLDTMQLAVGNNIFYFNPFKAKSNLLKNPYIEKAVISYNLPSKITVDIVERKVRSYVLFETTNSYLLIDEFGRVLDALSYMPEKLPVIVGLKVTGFTQGGLINTQNADKFEDVVMLSQLLTKYEIEDVVKVDVAELDGINLYIGNITFKFGGIEDADEKVRNIKQIILNFDTTLKGTVDITNIKKDPIFKYLT